MKFRGNVCFREITVSYLNQYELWLRNKEVSKTTISIYVRGLRTIFNEAIDAGLIKREKCYPFHPTLVQRSNLHCQMVFHP